MGDEPLLGKVTKDILNTLYLKADAPQLDSVVQGCSDDTKQAGLCGQTILIVQREIDTAIPLQDRIVQDGGTVLTAYSLSRATLIATSAKLAGAVIDHGMSGADQIVGLLKTRNIPYIFDAAPDRRSRLPAEC